MIIEYSENVKKPWSVIKETIGKEKKLAAIISKKSLCRKTGNHIYKIYSRKLQQLFCWNWPDSSKKSWLFEFTFDKYLKVYSMTQPEKTWFLMNWETHFSFSSLKKVQVTAKLVLMRLRNNFESFYKFYFIYLMFHCKMEMFQMS